jgi:hypothetical protein
MSALRSAFGFYAVLVGPITWQHLARQAVVGELIDALVSTLMFSLAYAAGLALARVRRISHSPHAFRRGAAAGAVALALAFGLWIPMPHDLRYSFGVWALVGNLGICALAAILVEFASSRALYRAAR